MSTMKRVMDTLQDAQGALTMGELMVKADLDKRFAGDVSSCLSKLVARDDVQVRLVQSRSRLGKRVVREYVWVCREAAPPPPPPVRVEDDPRRMLGAPLLIGRLG